MKVKINIECDSGDQLLAHLQFIRHKIRKEMKKQGGDIENKFRTTDNNCYGLHNATVTPDARPTNTRKKS